MTQDNEFDPNDLDDGDEQYDRDSVEQSNGLVAADSLNGNGVIGGGDGNGRGDGFEDVNFGLGSVQNVALERVMRTAYLNYAMSVIVSRALPDARDGLKPVHRRILYAMYDLNMGPTSAYKKSARIVGEVLGKYHPHGDSSVYDAMARMAQDFSLRYLLVDGQGNFGSVDGDAPAAMRYTEARLHRHAEALLQDLDMDTVDWQPNFDDSLREPQVLPAMLPNFLLNGTSGIAVGMATNVPPHNLNEIADGIVFVIDNWERRDTIETAELMHFVKGPDFPTGGIILGTEGISRAFATGQGRIVVRAKAEVDETRNNARIIIREIPYQVNKSTLIEKIAELAREGRVEGIRDLRDESDRKGMRIVIEIKSNASALPVLNQLYKSTALQSSFSVNTLALVNGQPKVLSLRASIIVYIEHREEVITRRTEFQLGKARERAHILEGLRIALEYLDEVIRIIRESENAEAARGNLMARFGLSQVQAQAILDMQLRRLANLERQRIEDEYQEILQKITYYLDLLSNPGKIRALVRDDILMLKEKFGDARRTEIDIFGDENIDITKLVPLKTVMLMISKDSSIKAVPVEEFRKTGRGAVGIKGAELRKDDLVGAMVTARTHDTVLFFTDRGRVFSTPVYKLPQANRTQKGQHINQYLNLAAGERVTAMIPVSDFSVADFITLITRKGTIKRMYLDLFANVRPSGIIAMSLEDGDSLDWARLTNGSQDFILTTRGGKASRFDENTVRPMGRGAFGVNGMKLREDDTIVSLEVVREDGELLVISERGYGKRVPLSEFMAKGRNIQGYWVTDHTKLEETGPIVAARVVHPNDQITVITANGSVARMDVDKISRIGRMTKGVIIQKLRPGDVVAALAVVKAEEIGEDDEQLLNAEGAENGQSEIIDAEIVDAEIVDAEMDAVLERAESIGEEDDTDD